MKYIITTLAAFIVLFSAGFAHAADPFTVSDVPVDATGSSPIEAQTLATRDGQARAANILLNRLTVESERLAKGTTPISEDNAQKMIRAMEIDNEKRSSTRYLGDITVAFNPSAVQAYLRQVNLTMISSQSRDRLVLPLSNGQIDTLSPWFQAWEKSGAEHALTPIRALSVSQAETLPVAAGAISAMDAGALNQIGALYNVQQLLIADDLGGAVRVTDIALDSGQRQNFTVNGGPSVVIDKLETEWKSAAVSVAANAVEMPISILYDNHSEWLRLKDAINDSAQIQDARIDALSKDGALMTITYGGDINRLRNELSFKGVDIREDPKMGVVLGRTGRF
ncbi:DUF2066 domain-containing protein [Hellea sp.]|nr:DUF2066 domain-containing protein [Hellea sp.]